MSEANTHAFSDTVRRGSPLLRSVSPRLYLNAQDTRISRTRVCARLILQWLYASSIIYCPMAFATKMTLLLLIARIFAIKRHVSRSIHIFIVCLFVAYLPIQSVKIALCNPIRAYWDPSAEGHFLSQRKIFLSDLCLAIVTDLVILIIPIPLIWRLQMSWRHKLKIAVLLGAGGAATGVTIRLYRALVFNNSKDVASDFVLLDILTWVYMVNADASFEADDTDRDRILEVTIGLVCSCLPAVNILFEQYHSPANSARSPRADSKDAHRRRHHRLSWDGLGTTVPKEFTEEIAGSASETQRAIAPATANFDSELQIISGYSSEGPTVLNSGAVDPDGEHGLDIERVNSDSGRKEGWLVFASPDLSPGMSDLSDQAHGDSRTGHPGRQTMLTLAAANSDKPWQGIWQGQKSVT